VMRLTTYPAMRLSSSVRPECTMAGAYVKGWRRFVSPISVLVKEGNTTEANTLTPTARRDQDWAHEGRFSFSSISLDRSNAHWLYSLKSFKYTKQPLKNLNKRFLEQVSLRLWI